MESTSRAIGRIMKKSELRKIIREEIKLIKEVEQIPNNIGDYYITLNRKGKIKSYNLTDKFMSKYDLDNPNMFKTVDSNGYALARLPIGSKTEWGNVGKTSSY